MAAFPSSYAAFFPNELMAHPGDTIRFVSNFTGEPHTVTMGTAVDAGLQAWEAAPAGTDPRTIDAMRRLPVFFPGGAGLVQAAAQPCFLTGGDPPLAHPCATQSKPEFNGTQAFFNSGWLPDHQTFQVQLAPELKPGRYRYLCLVHRVMTGVLNVVAPINLIPTPDAVTRRAAGEIDEVAAHLKQAMSLTPALPAGRVNAGLIPANESIAIANLFAPKQLTIPAGSVVTWALQGPHTVSFNPPADAMPAIRVEPGGAVALNPMTVAPANSAPVQPPPATIDGGDFDGTGFKSSGILESFAPYNLYRLRFTRPGAFSYACLLHPGMAGTVHVT